jgi:PilZ domain
MSMDNDKKARAAAASAESGGAAASAQPANDQSAGGQPSGSQPSGSKAAFTRRFPRFVIDVRLQVKMFQAGEFRTCWGRSTEMGQDGIGATLTGSLENGEIVTLEIPLPLSPYPIKVRAIVRYRQGLRYGFEFLTLNDGQRDTIKRVCQYLATKA